MPSLHLHVPEPLYERVMGELDDDVNLSAILQAALARALEGEPGCHHELVECSACGRIGPPGELATGPA